MESKKLKLLFNDSIDQSLSMRSKSSMESDGESDHDILDLLYLFRLEADRRKNFDKMTSKLPYILVSVTDYNRMNIYQGMSLDEIRNECGREPTFLELNGKYAFNKRERRRLEVADKIKIITGAEVSGTLNGLNVSTYVYDFDEKIFGLFRYTKDKYRRKATSKANVKTISAAAHLSKGKIVLAHPSRYVREGKISLNDILTAAYNNKCFDGRECADSMTTIDECFEILRFCTTHNIPVTIGSGFRCFGKETVKGASLQREDAFFVESLGMRTGDFLRLVVGKSVEQLNEIERSLKNKTLNR